MKTLKKQLLGVLAFLLVGATLLAIFIRSIDEEKNIKPSTRKLEQKLLEFNSVESAINSMSKVGIGDMGTWKGDSESGYFACTPYFQLEQSSGKLANNLAIYLESDNRYYVQSAKLVLNLNDKRYKNDAIKEFGRASNLILKEFKIDKPKDFDKFLKKPTPHIFEEDNCTIEIEKEPSNIITWRLIITSKPMS